MIHYFFRRSRVSLRVNDFAPQAHELKIVNDGTFAGKSFVCQCMYDNRSVIGCWSLASGSQYATMNSNGKVEISSGVQSQTIEIHCEYGGMSASKQIVVSYGNQLDIECASLVAGTSGNAIARYNSSIVQPTWSLADGSSVLDLSADGSFTILASGQAALSAYYSGCSAQKTIAVELVQGKTTQTEVNEDGSVTTETQTVIENPDGSTTTTVEATTTSEDGSTSTVQETTVVAEDGSSTSEMQVTRSDGTSSTTQSQATAPDEHGTTVTTSTTVNYDQNGNEANSIESTTTSNADGSSSSTTTSYNAEGDPTSQENVGIDTDGNASSQSIAYSSSGDPVVTGYNIDTSSSSEGAKEFDADGVNTEFYGFDSVDGFVMNLHFTIDFTDQPPDQNQNHHQILSMKRADPSPWYGFQLRQSSTNKYIQLGTQFEFGSNTNTTISPQAANWVVENQIAEYNIQVTYDPTLFSDTFVCRELKSNRNVFSSSYLFPDLEELRYLTVCIGYGLDENAQAYRFSKINVLNFTLQKIPKPLALPVLSFASNVITMSCSTQSAEVYYKTSQAGSFVKYTAPVEVHADTTVQAYSKLGVQTSETVSQTFYYDDGIDEPVITCDGEFVEINCDTPAADIFYRTGTSGQFLQYEAPFEISSTVTVQAYAVIDGKQSQTVSQSCIYVPVTLVAPTIDCSNNLVVVSCTTPRAAVYCRLGGAGSFSLYEGPFEISQDTLVEAYSSYREQTSTTVSETCIYVPDHDYSQDYLTFKILSAGTVCWKAFGSLAKTIEYSINNGAWTSITSTAAGTTFSVAKDDVVRFRGSNTAYATSKSAYSGFEGGTASFDVEGNIMSLLYGDGFASNTALTNSTYQFCSLFKKALVVSAKNLVLPATTLKNYCYRALFSWCTTLVMPPALPATTLASGCYWYMFEQCAIAEAPVLNAAALKSECYGHMFTDCALLDTIQCFATSGFDTAKCLEGWTTNVANNGTFVKSSNASSWTTGVDGIPTGWAVCNDILLRTPTVSFDGETIELECGTVGAEIHYRLGQTGEYQLYTLPVSIVEDTVVEAYATYQGYTSQTVSQTCTYVQETPFQMSNKDLLAWRHGGSTVTTPYSVNRIDGHSSSYAKGSFTFDTQVTLRAAQPAYLWFQHADQSIDIYVDNVKVETHWGGYNAFFCDISQHVHRGTNNIKAVLCNTTRNTLAPAAGDFNFNATLGNVKLFTSPVLPAMKYGYDGFHITSTVTSSSATVYVKTTVPQGAQLVCTISDGSYTWSDTQASTSQEQTFSTTISGGSLHLWDGVDDPHLYNVKLEIFKDGDLYHRYERPYGFRYYSYVINQTIDGQSYTGFLLNGHPYQLRGVCMHDDLAGKANALNDTDYDQQFAVIQELGCNFIRLAHYPHPKEVYDRCDALGIIVQTEVPCVNKLQSTMPEDYYTHLTAQYKDMVEQHFNHPCILFWGLSNETSTDDKAFGKAKIEEYYALIKSIDQERWVGYVMSHSYNNPASYYNDPDVDWFGSNLYVGWYIDKASNDPTSQINTRINNTITRLNKPLALSEYGAGGTQHCHSEEFKTTTTPGNYARHDIEYQMWLHEGHIAAIRNFPQLLFTGEWQLFDIAVSNRNEGYTVCLDGENTSTDDELRRLNNKGLVERDHVTKKDTFYIYKAEWNTDDKFVHICGKDYTKTANRKLKCYTNDIGPLSLYEGSSQDALETVQVTDHIAQFTARTFSTGVEYRVVGVDASDSITFQTSN